MTTDLQPFLDLLAPFYEPADARRWLQSPQLLLGGAVPLDLIRSGSDVDVYRVLFQLSDGAYV